MRSVAKEVGRNGITCNTLSLASQNNAGFDESSDMRFRQLKAYIVPRLGTATTSRQRLPGSPLPMRPG